MTNWSGGGARSSDRGDAAILRARDALGAGRFDEVAALLAAEQGLAAEVRAFGIAALPQVGPAFASWHARTPDDPTLNLLLAIGRLDDLAWLASALAKERNQQQQYHDEVESLRRAVEHLRRALREQPDNPAGRVWLASAMGALVWRDAAPRADADRCAREAEAAVPDSVQTVRWRVHLAARGNDGAAALALAEEAACAWPPGDPRHAEVASAHVHRYHHLLKTDTAAASAYFKHADVLRSLVAADERFAGGSEHPAAFDAASVFAFTLTRTNEPKRARPHLHRIDGQVLTWPWAILRRPDVAYAELSEKVRRSSVLRRRR